VLGAFTDTVSDQDWEHALGGIHALAYEDGELVGHASVIQRRLLHQGRALRTGYVEAVAVRGDRRRRGHADAMMAKLERVIGAAYDLGALGASTDGQHLYEARGWQRWRGPVSTLTPHGIEPTPEERNYIYVLPLEKPIDGLELDLDGELTCDWRDGDVW
jgi:aminoglycoside 2'-N-acetyltransferase I